MSARSPLICSAVELWYKKMLKIGSLSELTGIDTKIKVAGFQRLYSKWLWLLMAVYKPSFADAQNGVALHYKLSPQIENLNGQYTICNVNNTMHRKQGEVQSSNGVISIIDLPKGIYTFSITCNGKTYSTKWMK